MTAETILSELDQNRRMMRDCQKFAAPDWEPKAVREEWNQWAGKFKPIRK